MSEPRVIWSGTYAGIDADIRMVNGKPVPFLAGRATAFMRHAEGVLGAAVMGLAAERDELRERVTYLEADNTDRALAHAAIFQQHEELTKRCIDLENELRRKILDSITVRRQHDELRERLAKLEAGLATACNEWEYASQYKGEFLAEKHGDAEDIADLRELLKGPGDVET